MAYSWGSGGRLGSVFLRLSSTVEDLYGPKIWQGGWYFMVV